MIKVKEKEKFEQKRKKRKSKPKSRHTLYMRGLFPSHYIPFCAEEVRQAPSQLMG